MSIVIFIIILFVLIVVHEFGHFFTAKLFKMRVDEFGLGYPPKAVTLFTKGETKYTLNWLPFGGFVKIFGEDSNGVKDPRSFVNKAWYKQAVVLIAGVVMNFVLAWIFLSAGFMSGLPGFTGEGTSVSGYVRDAYVSIQNVTPLSPAEKGGLVAGDKILYIQDPIKKEVHMNLSTVTDVRKEISESTGTALVVGVERKDGVHEVTVIPKKNENGAYMLGVTMEQAGTLKLPFFKALGFGFTTAGEVLGQIAQAFGHLISDAFKGTADLSSLTGPVGIVGIVGDAFAFGWANLFLLIAMISLNLVIINLIPFPALDGGRLLFVLIEAITRKKIPAKFTGIVNMIGFVLLISLMVFVTYRDVVKLLHR